MKEYPILFSGPMVRAILEGRKTQTRRVIKPQPDVDGLAYDLVQGAWTDTSAREYPCPYGKPGDRLWVRETWQAFNPQIEKLGGAGPFAGAKMRIYAYPAIEGKSIIEYKADRENNSGSWRPSIHMPRWASRINLEVVNVRVERVQEISEEDAEAEGSRGLGGIYNLIRANAVMANMNPDITVFRALWDSINAKRGFGWDVNPWVWVIEFKRIPLTSGQ